MMQQEEHAALHVAKRPRLTAGAGGESPPVRGAATDIHSLPATVANGSSASALPASEGAPTWVGQSGVKRIASELKMLNQEARLTAEPLPRLRPAAEGSTQIVAGLGKSIQIRRTTSPIFKLATVGDDISRWRLQMKDFDEETDGGRQLNKDLAQLREFTGQDHLLLEVLFPKDYPARPFFLRVVSPRCVMYTGHVTAGGSICSEALSQTGTKDSWRADLCVSGLLPLVKLNMINAEKVLLGKTKTGPGGMAGPLRVNFDHVRQGQPPREYSEKEAREAFARSEEHHKSVGWGK